MCYTVRCFWEDNGECTIKDGKNRCPEQMDDKCECGGSYKQLQGDGKYHCVDCGKIIA